MYLEADEEIELPEDSVTSADQADHVPSGVGVSPLLVAKVKSVSAGKFSDQEIVSQAAVSAASKTEEIKVPEE